jgi:hypothetical protein
MITKAYNMNEIQGMDLRDFSNVTNVTKEIINLRKDHDGWSIRDAKKTIHTIDSSSEAIKALFTQNDRVVFHIDKSVFIFEFQNDTIGELLEKYEFDYDFSLYPTNFNNVFFQINETNGRNYVLELTDRVLSIIDDTGNLTQSTELLLHAFDTDSMDTVWGALAKNDDLDIENNGQDFTDNMAQYFINFDTDGTFKKVSVVCSRNKTTGDFRYFMFADTVDEDSYAYIFPENEEFPEKWEKRIAITNGVSSTDIFSTGSLARRIIAEPQTVGSNLQLIENMGEDAGIAVLNGNIYYSIGQKLYTNQNGYEEELYDFSSFGSGDIFDVIAYDSYLVVGMGGRPNTMVFCYCTDGTVNDVTPKTAQIVLDSSRFVVANDLLVTTSFASGNPVPVYFDGNNWQTASNGFGTTRTEIFSGLFFDNKYWFSGHQGFGVYDADFNFVAQDTAGDNFLGLTIYQNRVHVLYSAFGSSDWDLIRVTGITGETINTEVVYSFPALSPIDEFNDKLFAVKNVLYYAIKDLGLAVWNGTSWDTVNIGATYTNFTEIVISNDTAYIGIEGTGTLPGVTNTGVYNFYYVETTKVKQLVVDVDSETAVTSDYITGLTDAKQVEQISPVFSFEGSNYLRYIMVMDGSTLKVFLHEKQGDVDNADSSSVSLVTPLTIDGLSGITFSNFTAFTATEDKSVEAQDNNQRGFVLYVYFDGGIRTVLFESDFSVDSSGSLEATYNVGGADIPDEFITSESVPVFQVKKEAYVGINTVNYLYYTNGTNVVLMPFKGIRHRSQEVEQARKIYNFEISQFADVTGDVITLCVPSRGYVLTEINKSSKIPIRPYKVPSFFDDKAEQLYAPIATAFTCATINDSDVLTTTAKSNVELREEVSIDATVSGTGIQAGTKVVDIITDEAFRLTKPAVESGEKDLVVTIDRTGTTILGDSQVVLTDATGVEIGSTIISSAFLSGTTVQKIEGNAVEASTEAISAVSGATISFATTEEVELEVGSDVIRGIDLNKFDTTLVNAGTNYLVEGDGIQDGTYLTAKIDGQAVKMSRPATSSASNTITFTNEVDDFELFTVYEMLNARDTGFRSPISLGNGTSVTPKDNTNTYYWRYWILYPLFSPGYDKRSLGQGGVDFVNIASYKKDRVFYWESDVEFFTNQDSDIPFRFSNDVYETQTQPLAERQYLQSGKVFYKINDKYRDRFTALGQLNQIENVRFTMQDLVYTAFGLVVAIDYDNRRMFFSYGFKFFNQFNDIGLKSRPTSVIEIDNGNVVIFCENDIYVGSGTDDVNFVLQHVAEGIGLSVGNKDAVTTDGINTFFYNKNGVYWMRGDQLNKIDGMEDYLFKRSTGNKIGVHKSETRLYVPLDSTKIDAVSEIIKDGDYGLSGDQTISHNRYYGVYDYSNGGWSIYGFTVGSGSSEFFGQYDEYMVCQLGADVVIPEFRNREGDYENPLCRFTTRRYTVGNPFDLKHMYNLFLRFVLPDLVGTEYGINSLKVSINIDSKYNYTWKYGDYNAGETAYSDADFTGLVTFESNPTTEGAIDAETGVTQAPLPMNNDFRSLRITAQFGRIGDDTNHATAVFNRIELDVENKGRERGGLR